jgi:arylsulfatase A-like enzyme/tetratricopeptide (TPR) repeat protein
MARKKKAHATEAREAPPPSRRTLRVVGIALAALGLGVAGWWMLRPRRTSLLVITIDTLRADHVGAYGADDAATPHLDRLAARGARFARAQAPVPLTGPSHASLFTGQYPPVHGVRDNVTFSLGDRHPTLATLLAARGYRTAAFVAAYPVAADFGFARGFHEFHEDLHESPVPGEGAERPGNEVADQFIAWLERPARAPFFAWVHLYDPHAPYAPPPPFRERFAGRAYEGEIAFADAQVGRMLDALARQGRERDTLVVALADHGESLGEHGERTHALLVHEATQHVPLILAGPGIAPRVVEDRVGTVDVLPTVLRRLGVEPPAGLPGRDLGAALDGRALPREALYAESLFGRLNCRWAPLRAITDGDWKLVRGATSELFDLASDPSETQDRAAAEPERLARLESVLKAAVERMAPGGDSARPVSISPEQEERLRSLGYAAGGGGGGALDQPGLPDPRVNVGIYDRIQGLVQARGPAAAGALAALAQVAQADPGNPYAHFSLGTVAYRRGELALAAEAYTRTMELDPDRPGMRFQFGKLLREMGRLAESEQQLRMASEQSPGDVRTRASLADTLILEGRLDEANVILDAAVAREPHHLDVRRSQGRLRVAQGRAAEGLALLEGAAAGADPEPWIEIARVRLAQEDAPGALAAAEQAVSLNPAHPWALAVRGQALVRSGRRDEGVAALRRALAAGPRRPEVWRSLCDGFAAAGEGGAAAACRRAAAS